MMDWDDTEWIMKRQAEYDRRMSGQPKPLATSFEMDAIHNKVVQEIDLLPYEQGGRKLETE